LEIEKRQHLLLLRKTDELLEDIDTAVICHVSASKSLVADVRRRRAAFGSTHRLRHNRWAMLPGPPVRRALRRPGKMLCVVVLLAIASQGGPVTAEAPPLERAVFITQWLPQAQFAGYFVAYERGMYRQRGIDLTVVTGGPDRPASEWIENGQADFATLWLSTAIQLRARGVPIVNIAQVVERSSLMLVAKKASRIRNPGDMSAEK